MPDLNDLFEDHGRIPEDTPEEAARDRARRAERAKAREGIDYDTETPDAEEDEGDDYIDEMDRLHGVRD